MTEIKVIVTEEGKLNVKAEGIQGKEHVIYLLSTAIASLSLPEQEEQIEQNVTTVEEE